MSKKEIKAFLEKTSHLELLPILDTLNASQLSHLLEDARYFSSRSILDFAYRPQEKIEGPFENPTTISARLGPTDQVASIILAGGEGSRLGFNLPKALLPIPFRGETKRLIDIFLDKTPKGKKLTLLTSKSGYPILKKEKVDCLVQENLPYLTENFEWKLREDDGHLMQGPDGNGGLLRALFQSGYLEKLKKAGILYIEILPIDNPLLTPYDPLLIGAHIHSGSEITAKAFKREDPNEKVGVFALSQGKTTIIDYTKEAHTEALLWANINHMVLNISFLEKVHSLPIHWVKKGNFYKGEQFITDLLSLASCVSIIAVERKSSFTPIKTISDIKFNYKI
jgi:UDP-N-acetylglucosamine pyrophosphorylase